MLTAAQELITEIDVEVTVPHRRAPSVMGRLIPTLGLQDLPHRPIRSSAGYCPDDLPRPLSFSEVEPPDTPDRFTSNPHLGCRAPRGLERPDRLVRIEWQRGGLLERATLRWPWFAVACAR